MVNLRSARILAGPLTEDAFQLAQPTLCLVPCRLVNDTQCRTLLLLGLASSPGVGGYQFESAGGTDLLNADGRFVWRSDDCDRNLQVHGVLMTHEIGD